MKGIMLVLICVFLTQSLSSQNVNHWETVIYSSDVWHYLSGNSNPGTNWNQLNFDDTAWNTGSGGIGYGDGDDHTIIDVTPSVFLRMKFELKDLSNVETGVLHIDYDDAFVAYINGVEVARAGISGNPPVFHQLADNGHEAVMFSGGMPTEIQISKDKLPIFMNSGENILAIEVHNATANSSDMTAIAFLSFGISDTSFTYRVTPEWFSPPFTFSKSNLPIVVIETEDRAEIVDEPKVRANMRIMDHDAGNSVQDEPNGYDGNVGIEIRGSYSATLPQKSYGFETRDEKDANLNVKILGMPKENDWILSPNYNDKSFMRNAISYRLFDKMGHYAPRFQHCEVMLNNDYRGIYVMTERLKQDKNRINIAKLDEDDVAGDSLTGGYVFKIDNYSSTDYWVSNYHPIDRPSGTVRFVYHDPGADDLQETQKAYLQSYVDFFESVLYSNSFDDPETGYAKYIDVGSFVDYFIIGELSRNTDAYKKSRYFFKDKENKGGLIHSGPVWDFDWAYKNLKDDCDIFNQTDGSGWAYKKAGTSCSIRPIPCGWMVKLLEDPTFRNKLGKRYQEVRQSFMSNEDIHHFMDSISDVCAEAQTRHYQKFPILGKNTGAYEVDAIPDTYDGEVQKLKTWIDLRLVWLDENMPEPTVNVVSTIQSRPNVRIFPNPAKDQLFVESDHNIVSIEIQTVSSAAVFKDIAHGYVKKIDVSAFKKGMYVMKVLHSNKQISNHKLIVH